MKTIFTAGKAERPNDVLLLELGQEYCCYAFFDRAGRSFNRVSFLSFSEPEESLGEIWQGWNPRQAVICSAAVQALLVPQKFFKDTSFTPTVYNLNHHQELNDRIPEWQLLNSYAMPIAVYDEVRTRFPDARILHAYTPMLKVHNSFDAPDQLNLYFTPTNFRVLVKKGGQVQLAQTYEYKAPLDVVYFLLKICYEFGLEQSSVHLTVSGLVEQNSPLYEELSQYFLNLHLAPKPSYHLPEGDYPPYYFTSLYNLAACVS